MNETKRQLDLAGVRLVSRQRRVSARRGSFWAKPYVCFIRLRAVETGFEKAWLASLGPEAA
jgi:hypothetical protein